MMKQTKTIDRRWLKNVFAVALMSAWGQGASAQPASPFAPPTLVTGIGANLQAHLGVDMTRDGAPDLYTPAIFLSHFGVELNHDGSRIRQTVMPMFTLPTYPASQLPMVSGTTSANLDQDAEQLPDLVGVTSSGVVFWVPNNGVSTAGAATWGTPQVVDFFGPGAAVNPPFMSYSYPVIRAVDLNGDGREEIVVAGGRIDSWSGTTLPGNIFVYHNLVGGNFAKYALSIPGPAVDLEIADLNRDGTVDHIVAVTENPGWTPGYYGYDLVHAKFDPNAATPLWFSQAPFVLPGRVTSLEIGDFIGGASADYVFSTVGFVAHAGSSTLYVNEGDGLGGVISSSWATFNLPANTTGLGETVYSMRASDFDHDGNDDLVVLRNYTLGVSFASTQPVQYANADVFVSMGPAAYMAQATPIPLPGIVIDANASQSAAAQLPLRPVPDALHVYNFGLDRTLDLAIAPIGTPVTTSSGVVMQQSLAILKNQAAWAPLEPAIETLGAPSGGAASSPAVIGFDGGAPVLGNQAFGITVRNIPAGGLAGFAWGPVGVPNYFTTPEGIDVHIAPVEYSYTYVTQGAGATGGFARQPLPIPNNPALLGDVGYFQGAFYHSSIGFGGTAGTHVVVGQ